MSDLGYTSQTAFEYILVLSKSFIRSIFSNSLWIILFTALLVAFTMIYYLIRERFEEMNLFNLDLMSEEDRKMFIYTRKLTNINEKFSNKAPSMANTGKLVIYY